MTDNFEVHERDGAARLGELRLADPLHTPAIADDVLEDAGSRWIEDREIPEGDESTLTILPHRGFPKGTPEPVQEAFAVDHPEVDFPSAAVVSPTTAGDHGADAYVLSGAPGYVGHAEAFVEAVIATREAIPGDTALVLSGVATPGNVATLAYAGVDLVDTDCAVVRGTQGRYLATDGQHFLADLEELPCSCPACDGPREEFSRGACAAHNVNALRAEIARVRERIRAGRLRDYVEGQARHDAWTTAAVRRLDQQYGYLEERTPLVRRSDLLAATDDSIGRVEIQRFADRVTSRYRCRFDAPLVLVPCSASKPYSESQSHRQFHDAIKWRAHIVSVSSPVAVVPQELELTYPAQHYESVVTGRWSETEIEFVSTVLSRYLDRNEYPRVVAHVPPDGYRDVCERAAEAAGVDIEYTVEDHPTTEESLTALLETLDGHRPYRMREREHNTVRAMADYQFGDGAGDDLFEEISTESRYPKLRVRGEVGDLGEDGTSGEDGDPGEDGSELLATMVPEYGVLAFTLAGARRWVESDAPTGRVEIEAFVPHGSVLAPGVLDASDDIRVGDEVVVEGPAAFAVGRARMSGPEMVESTRGIAVQVRHCEER